MSELLRRLNKDHARVRRQMDILEEEAERFTLDPASRTIVRDVLDYMTSYPDRFHHPLEDRLFEAMDAAQCHATTATRRLEDEHAWLLAEGRELLVLAGKELPPAYLVARLTRYARRQRQHMRNEENNVFGAARRELEPAHWRRLAADAEPGPDPLFGRVVQERYRDLYAHIMRRHARKAARGS